MDSQSQLVSMGLVATTALTATFLAYLYGKKQHPYLRPWTAAWFLVALRALVIAMAPFLGKSPWIQALNGWLFATISLMFLWSAVNYAKRPLRGATLIASSAAFCLWSIAYHVLKVPVPPNIGTAAVFIGVAHVFFIHSRRTESTADRLMALGFLGWAPMPLLAISYGFGTSGTRAHFDLTLVSAVPQLLVAAMMVMISHEKEKRSAQGELLAISNLNLATSGLLGGGMPALLSQVLDSVLSTMRMPAGALLLHYGDFRGPKSFVSAGLDESFCRDLQQEGLDDYLMQLPFNANEAVVVLDLHSGPADLAAPQARHEGLRRLAARQGFRTVMTVALKTNDKNYGALLLASPSNKRPSTAELSLSQELSHQIAMAIENGYMVQQTWRRWEELRALNEIGLALNSMLDFDALLEKILVEVRRLFDMGNFYVALYDSERNELRFELEVAEGVRLAKRTRPAANHVTEHILRTCRPLLIRENFEAMIRELGLETYGRPGSYCGVPLIVCDRAIGVIAVRSTQERAFDKGHMEILRLLASETSIAIENARLFREEQTKSRHLALLNNISRCAISTLNPEEMLVDIAELLDKGLSFDHIGIAIFDDASKEVVVRAEAGRRRGALNRRLAIGEALAGSVASTRRMSVVPHFPAEGEIGPILEGSASGAALPILYADQLLGVLYVETRVPTNFSDGDLLLLRTLADLVAGVLHNAFAFQKAKEQAITDGLTGVKTHRFLRDALSAEWKRSTRGGKPFTLALIDVDRFKFVNDFQGHLEGDLVLKRLGQLLEQGCRSSDVVARYGGDEFVILMPETDSQQGLLLAEKLRACLSADRLLQARNTTASVGLSTFPDHGSTPQELIQAADAAMYLSKRKGGNAVSLADPSEASEGKQWKRDVLEAYLGVTLKRLLSTGPEAFQDVRQRLEQLWRSLSATEEPALDRTLEAAKFTEPLRMPSAEVVETIGMLAQAVDAKDPCTQGHSQKVAEYSRLLAEELGLGLEEVEAVRLGGLLHDVGKVGISAVILGKSGPLDAEEWEAMKEHAGLGDRLLEPLRSIGQIRGMVRHHHEMFDGSGYPDRLSGEGIPLGARIVGIADAYDTITSDRAYAKARTPAEALAELKRCAGTQFDPQLVRLFVRLAERQLCNAQVPVRVSGK